MKVRVRATLVIAAIVFIFAAASYFIGVALHDQRRQLLIVASVCVVGGVVLSIFASGLIARPFRTIQVQMEEALNEARRANEAKSSFLANMSHEMRTPLNAVIGLTDLILGSKMTQAECYEHHNNIEKINKAGMVLLSTVNDILDISKIEAGKFELVPVEYEMPSLINDIVNQSIMLKGEKPIDLVLDVIGNLPMHLFGDELRVKQILNNLLSNAIKYTKEGKVKLRIRCAPPAAYGAVTMTASISDTGIGIRPDHLERIFDDYQQTDIQANRAIMGTGLGLSITKRLASLMQGTVRVESDYGRGSVFTVTLQQRYVDDTVIGDDTANNLKNFHYYYEKRNKAAELVRTKMPYARVLIVDDVATNLDVAKGLMRPYGMQIDCVTSGRQAVEAIRDEKVRYNAVFMDHMMPGMDGVVATQLIREIDTEYARTVPIIALTANAVIGNEQKFLDAGFQAYITKPIEISRLDSVIRQWVRDKGKECKQDMQEVQDIQDMQNMQEEAEDCDCSQCEHAPQAPLRIASLATHFEGGGAQKGAGGCPTPAAATPAAATTAPAAPTTAADIIGAFRDISGIDAVTGLARFGGDAETYLDVLRSFAINTPNLIKSIRRVTIDTLGDYSIVVHGIKGASRSICAQTLGDSAEALEKAARTGDFDFVADNNPLLVHTAEKLVVALGAAIAAIDEANPKPKKEKPDEEALARLMKACKEFDMDGVDAVIAQLVSYEYTADGGLVRWLKEMAEDADFFGILEKLSARVTTI